MASPEVRSRSEPSWVWPSRGCCATRISKSALTLPTASTTSSPWGTVSHEHPPTGRESGVFGAADPVFHTGVGAVAGLQPLQRTDAGVGDECGVAPAVGLLEQRQLGAGVRTFPTHDHPHPGRPAGHAEQTGEFGASAPSRTPPSALTAGDHADAGRAVIAARSGSPIDQPSEYSTTRPRRWPCVCSQLSTVWVLAAESPPISRCRRCAAGRVRRRGRMSRVASGAGGPSRSFLRPPVFTAAAARSEAGRLRGPRPGRLRGHRRRSVPGRVRPPRP